MNITQLNAISPIDGRYRNKVAQLANYFSEEARIKFRVLVEIEYFIALCEIPLPQLDGFDKTIFPELKKGADYHRASSPVSCDPRHLDFVP